MQLELRYTNFIPSSFVVVHLQMEAADDAAVEKTVERMGGTTTMQTKGKFSPYFQNQSKNIDRLCIDLLFSSYK